MILQGPGNKSLWENVSKAAIASLIWSKSQNRSMILSNANFWHEDWVYAPQKGNALIANISNNNVVIKISTFFVQ